MDEQNEKVVRYDPIYVTDNESGVKYTLDFNRESIAYMEKRGIRPTNIESTPVSVIEDMFASAFRMHHPTVSKDKANKLLNVLWDYYPPMEIATRLVNLYAQAVNGNSVTGKNAKVTLEM